VFVCIGQQRKFGTIIWALACGWSAIYCSCNYYGVATNTILAKIIVNTTCVEQNYRCISTELIPPHILLKCKCEKQHWIGGQGGRQISWKNVSMLIFVLEKLGVHIIFARIVAIVAVRKPKICHGNFVLRTHVQLTKKTCHMKTCSSVTGFRVCLHEHEKQQ
jgi:hypothetical protein